MCGEVTVDLDILENDEGDAGGIKQLCREIFDALRRKPQQPAKVEEVSVSLRKQKAHTRTAWRSTGNQYRILESISLQPDGAGKERRCFALRKVRERSERRIKTRRAVDAFADYIRNPDRPGDAGDKASLMPINHTRLRRTRAGRIDDAVYVLHVTFTGASPIAACGRRSSGAASAPAGRSAAQRCRWRR